MASPEIGGPTPEEMGIEDTPQEADLKDGTKLRVGEVYDLPSVAGKETRRVRITSFDSRGKSVMFEVIDKNGNVTGGEGGDIERFKGAQVLDNGKAEEAEGKETPEVQSRGIGNELVLDSSDVRKYKSGTWYESGDVTGLIRSIDGMRSTITVVEVPRSVMVHSSTIDKYVEWKVVGCATYNPKERDLLVSRKRTAAEERKHGGPGNMEKEISFSEVVS